MARMGRLNMANAGTTMPADAPAYHRKPFHFRRARLLRFDYETDADAAAALIPDMLELPEPVTATLLLNDYPWSTLGPYREAVLAVPVRHAGAALLYTTHLMLDRAVLVLAGRELYGFPKKLGVVEWCEQDDVLAAYVERPRGIRICSGVFRAQSPLPAPPAGTALATCALRIIGSPEAGRDCSLVELIRTDLALANVEMWSGEGGCHFAGESILDPWHRLPVRRMLSSTLIVTDFVLDTGTILATIRP